MIMKDNYSGDIRMFLFVFTDLDGSYSPPTNPLSRKAFKLDCN